MQSALVNLFSFLRNVVLREEGQDLVEYALVIALIALGATAGMNTIASDLSSAFSSIGSTITTAI